MHKCYTKETTTFYLREAPLGGGGGGTYQGESLFPKGSHYLLVNNDRGESLFTSKKWPEGGGGGGGSFFPGSHFPRLQPGLENMYVFKNHASAIS